MPGTPGSSISRTRRTPFKKPPVPGNCVGNGVAEQIKEERSRSLGYVLFKDRADMAEDCYDFLARTWFSQQNSVSLNGIRTRDETLFLTIAGDVRTLQNFHASERNELSAADNAVCRTALQLRLLDNRSTEYSPGEFRQLQAAIALTRPQRVTRDDCLKQAKGISHTAKLVAGARIAAQINQSVIVRHRPASELKPHTFDRQAVEIFAMLDPNVPGYVKTGVGSRLDTLVAAGAYLHAAREGDLPQPIALRLTEAMKRCIATANAGLALPELPSDFVEAATLWVQGQNGSLQGRMKGTQPARSRMNGPV